MNLNIFSLTFVYTDGKTKHHKNILASIFYKCVLHTDIKQ